MNVWFTKFRSVKECSVNFKPGITALTGVSGSGKTTLITAIGWILYGSAGTGVHKATKIANQNAWATIGVIDIKLGSDTVYVLRISNGKRKKDEPPLYIPAVVREAILSFNGNSTYESIWINGKLQNFNPARDKYFGCHAVFSSMCVVAQKLKSNLLTRGSLPQIIRELFFSSDNDDPDHYVSLLASKRKNLIESAKKSAGELVSVENMLIRERNKLAALSITQKDVAKVSMITLTMFDGTVTQDTYTMMVKRYQEIRDAISVNNARLDEVKRLEITLPDLSVTENRIAASNPSNMYPRDISWVNNALENIKRDQMLYEEQQRLKSALQPSLILHSSKEHAMQELTKCSKQTSIKNLLEQAGLATANKLVLQEHINKRELKLITDTESYKRAQIVSSYYRDLNDAILQPFNSTFLTLVMAHDNFIASLTSKNMHAKNIHDISVRDHDRDVCRIEAETNGKLEAQRILDAVVPEIAKLELELEQMGVPAKCPCCNVMLYVTENKSLVIAKEYPVDKSPKTVEFIRAKLEKLLTKKNHSMEIINRPIDMEITKIVSYDPVPVPRSVKFTHVKTECPKEISPPTDTLANIKTLRELAAQYDPDVAQSSHIRASLAAIEAENRYNDHVSLHGKRDKPSDVSAQLHEFRNALEEHNNAVLNHRTISQNISAVKKEIQIITMPDDLEFCFQLFNSALTYIDVSNRITELEAEENHLRNQHRTFSEKIAAFVKAEEFLNNAKLAFIETALQEITQDVCHVLKALFSGDSNYTLTRDGGSLETTLQLDGRMDVDPSDLSGGELDRFSIAITVGFARLRGVPFLFFDETIASLDPETRYDCIAAVRNLLPDCPVIFVAHDVPENLFESIVHTSDIIS